MTTPDPSTCVAAASLDDVKLHMRVDNSEEDTLIGAYILAASQMAEHIMGREIIKRGDENAICTDVSNVPATVKAWIYLYCSDLYENRAITEGGDSKKRNYDHLLDPWVIYWRYSNESGSA
jgi:uncharacterized phage protein (predicted DNA packaging)